ncbi:MAG: universal stress protein [Betaproteobacteria bacterium]|nr:universal stress protein [Betaproteobacteria bacterium]
MRNVLVPMDGSESALRALRHLIAERDAYREPLHVVLLNVQPAVLSGAVRMFVGADQIEKYCHDEGESALRAARDLLAGAGVSHEHHILVGEPAESIARFASGKSCGSIVMGSRGLGAVSGLILGSVATKVIHLSTVPVTLVR